MSQDRLSLALIGMGPRGLSVLERLCANVPELGPGRRIDIHVVDPHEPGPGAVWRTGQSRHLLMNTVASQVTLFTDPSVDCAGPIVAGPSLYEWARFLVLMGAVEEHEPWVFAEAERLGPNTYSTRAFYGQYLAWVMKRLRRTAPEGVVIRVHRTRAAALDDAPDGRQEIRLAGVAEPLRVDGVVLAMGHVPSRLTATERWLADMAERHQVRYLPPANPADAELDAIPAGEPVILRGLGLNFFDYLALFTVGRGGRFTRIGDRLRYQPSGREPKLFAGSRRGVPYHARGENEKGAHGRHEPLYLTQAVIDRFRAQARRGVPIDMKRDVWPLVAKEVETVYYATLLAGSSCGCQSAEFVQRYRTATWDSPEEQLILAEFGVAETARWSWDKIAQPAEGLEFADREAYQSWLLGWLREDAARARRGNVSDPLKAALDVLRDLRNEVRLIVDHAATSGKSYRDDLQRWYTPLNAFLSIGPPVSRIEELIAVIEAGVIEVLGPGLEVGVVQGRFLAESRVVSGRAVEARVLIEARLPEPDIRRSTDPLLTHLLKSGAARPYEIPNLDGRAYQTGGLSVTERPYRLIDRDGIPHPRRFAYGVPTEGVHWVTAVGIRPGVNSVTLSDSDAIARSLLSLDTSSYALAEAGLGSLAC